ncbi:MAG: hypothetical protein EPO19_14885, partial [Betaproteobacteria bacterium]
MASWFQRRPNERLQTRAKRRALSKSRRGEAMDEQAFRLETRKWIGANFPQEWRFPPHRLSLRHTETWQRKLYEKGWSAPSWPEQYGGMGLTA